MQDFRLFLEKTLVRAHHMIKPIHYFQSLIRSNFKIFKLMRAIDCLTLGQDMMFLLPLHNEDFSYL